MGKDYRPVIRRFRHELPSPVAAHPRDDELTPERQSLFRQTLARRVKGLTVVLDGCHDQHNGTAVIRSCEAMGLQHVHVITDRVSFKINRRIAQGAQFYTDIHVHASVEDCYAWLRERGYQIAVTDLAEDAVAGPHELLDADGQLPQPLALVFGSEGFGVSPAASTQADQAMLIPMAGMVQSLNLSVSVAIAVHALRAPALAADAPGDLTVEEQTALYDRWVARGRRPALHDERPGATSSDDDIESYS
jgi:tRNA (guanosine-2'-O-)-methyltransferase